MKKLLTALLISCCTAVSATLPLPALAQNAITLPIAANAVADLGNGPIKVRMVAGNASIFTSQSSGVGSTSGSSTALTLTATPTTPPLVGGLISGSGITSGTTVAAYNGTTGITLSAAMTVPASTPVSWGAACPSSSAGIPAAYIQASPQAGYYIMYTQARVCAVSPGGPVNTLLVAPIFQDGGGGGGGGGGTPGGATGNVQTNNGIGGFSGISNTQLTAQINLATATLAGALPAWPNNTTTFLRGDGTYAIPSASGLAGLVPLASGGTNNALTASAGGLVWSDSSKLNILAGTSTAGLCLLSGNAATPTWGPCSGAAAVASVNDSGAGTLSFSPATGAVLGAINLANANTWTGEITVNINGSSTVPLLLTTPGSGEYAYIQFADSGPGKWELGKDNSNNFFLLDSVAGRTVFQAVSNGNLYVFPAGAGETIFTGIIPLQITSASVGAQTGLPFNDSGTTKWQLQKDASNNFDLFDAVASRNDIQVASNGNFALMPGGGGVSFGLTSGLNVPAGGLVSAGDAYLGSGRPWMDVRAGANGCTPGAVGAGLADDHSAFQCAANYMHTTFAGGVVYVPCGSYFFNGNTVTVPIDVIIQGEGIACTNVKNTTDVTVFAFPSSVSGGGYGGLRDLTVIGDLSPSATQDVVTVGGNSLINFYTINIIGGRFALNDCGVDGTIFNSFIAGYSGGLFNCGANWWRRVKFDGPAGSGVATTYAIFQAQPFAGINPAENHYDMVDMSNGWSASFNVADTTGTTISMFTHSVFANPISITSGMVGITASELTGGSGHLTNGGILSVTGNLVVTGGTLTITGGGTLKCAGNYNITNTGC